MTQPNEFNEAFDGIEARDLELEAERQAEWDDLQDLSDDEAEALDAEYDGQPSEYQEWQDYMGGDDWDFGQFDNDYDY